MSFHVHSSWEGQPKWEPGYQVVHTRGPVLHVKRSSSAPLQVNGYLSFFHSILSITVGIQLDFNVPLPLMHHKLACDSVTGIGVLKHQLLQTEIDTLKQKHATERAPSTLGFYACVCLVLKKNGEKCPVFNMKSLNKFITARSFRMVMRRMVFQSLRQGDFPVSLDMLNAYFHVLVAKS